MVTHFCVVLMPYFLQNYRNTPLRWTIIVLMFPGPQFGLRNIFIMSCTYVAGLFRPAFGTSYSIRDYPFDQWFFCPGVYWYGLGPCGMSFCHSSNLPGCVCCYTVFHVCCYWGGSAGQWRGGWFLSPAFMVFPVDFPAWGRFGNLVLGLGPSCLFGCLEAFIRRSSAGSTIVLEGVV